MPGFQIKKVYEGMKFTLLFLCVLVQPSGELFAQVSGTVKTSGGDPVSGVTIEAWSQTRRIAAVLSETDGRFRFSGDVEASIFLLRAAGLGFERAELIIEDEVKEYHFVLTEDPLVIDGLVVITNQEFCEFQQGDVSAERLWEQARLRYSGLMDTLGIASYLAEADTVVSITELGTLQLPDLNLSQRGSSSLLRFSWTRRISRQGYAFSTRATDGVKVYQSWVYPPLEADFAPHFIDELFGERHYLRILDESPEGWRVSFCPKDDDYPSISGIIALAPDTTFATIRWSFDTPEPIENAGGSILFSPVSPGDSALYLLPREAITWKSLPDGYYLQKYQRYEAWHVAPGDSVPLLPLRHSPGSRQDLKH